MHTPRGGYEPPHGAPAGHKGAGCIFHFEAVPRPAALDSDAVIGLFHGTPLRPHVGPPLGLQTLDTQSTISERELVPTPRGTEFFQYGSGLHQVSWRVKMKTVHLNGYKHKFVAPKSQLEGVVKYLYAKSPQRTLFLDPSRLQDGLQ